VVYVFWAHSIPHISPYSTGGARHFRYPATHSCAVQVLGMCTFIPNTLTRISESILTILKTFLFRKMIPPKSIPSRQSEFSKFSCCKVHTSRKLRTISQKTFWPRPILIGSDQPMWTYELLHE
jgi:hypothetical protein